MSRAITFVPSFTSPRPLSIKCGEGEVLQTEFKRGIPLKLQETGEMEKAIKSKESEIASLIGTT